MLQEGHAQRLVQRGAEILRRCLPQCLPGGLAARLALLPGVARKPKRLQQVIAEGFCLLDGAVLAERVVIAAAALENHAAEESRSPG